MNGILLIDKPQDWTSNDVVAKLRGVLHEKRIGHSGTLDPMATGLLVVFVGRATRAVEFAMGHDKCYRASLRLGISTDTQDITGKVLSSRPADVSREQLEEVLCRFRGDIMQIPPMYSAIKHNGRRLYEIARSGGEVERSARKVRIEDISIAGSCAGDWLLDVKCSKGTYIRTLCNDIGESLGCGGCMAALRRTKAGAYSVEAAHSLDEVIEYARTDRAQELMLKTDSLFSGTKSYILSSDDSVRIRCGASVKAELSDGDYLLYSPEGEFLSLARQADGKLRTIKSFFEVN